MHRAGRPTLALLAVVALVVFQLALGARADEHETDVGGTPDRGATALEFVLARLNRMNQLLDAARTSADLDDPDDLFFHRILGALKDEKFRLRLEGPFGISDSDPVLNRRAQAWMEFFEDFDSVLTSAVEYLRRDESVGLIDVLLEQANSFRIDLEIDQDPNFGGRFQDREDAERVDVLLTEMMALLRLARQEAAEDAEAAIRLLLQAESVKHEINDSASFTNTQVLGVSVADWMDFVDAFDVALVRAGQLADSDLEAAKVQIDEAQRLKEALEAKLRAAVSAPPATPTATPTPTPTIASAATITTPSAATTPQPQLIPTPTQRTIPTGPSILLTGVDQNGRAPVGSSVGITVTGLTPNGFFTKALCRDTICETSQLQAEASGRWQGSTGPLLAGNYTVNVFEQASGRSAQASFQVR